MRGVLVPRADDERANVGEIVTPMKQNRATFSFMLPPSLLCCCFVRKSFLIASQDRQIRFGIVDCGVT